jgi:hypothetical protein
VRPEYWKKAVEKHGGYSVIYLRTNMSEADSLKLEHSVISNKEEYPHLVNKRNCTVKKLPDVESILLDLIYSDSSPSGFFRKEGDTLKVAGYKLSSGHWEIGLHKQRYLSHRLVYHIHHPLEDISSLVIHHLDCNPSNNRINNLEAISQEDNMKKTSVTLGLKLSSANRSGVNGVTSYFIKDVQYWVAYIYQNGRRKSKAFPTSKYGDNAFHMAIAIRKSWEKI